MHWLKYVLLGGMCVGCMPVLVASVAPPVILLVVTEAVFSSPVSL